MTQSNLSTGTASRNPTVQRPALMHAAGASLGHLHHVDELAAGAGHPPGAYVPGAHVLDAHALATLGRNDAALELAYGCVDWFIYVTD
jgi:hypothetical protein